MKGAVHLDRSFRHDGIRVATCDVAPSCRSAEGKREGLATHGVAGVYTELAGFRTSRYQSTVARRPSGKLVVDRQPNSAKAREASTLRRGWPSGCDGSKRISPANPVASAINWASSETRISSPLPR